MSSPYSSDGEIGMSQDELCENNNECGEGLFCCLVPDAAGNCNFALDQSCTCRSRSAVTDCSDVTPGDGSFGAPCRNEGDCSEGMPCCTSTAVSLACGVDVDFCECIELHRSFARFLSRLCDASPARQRPGSPVAIVTSSIVLSGPSSGGLHVSFARI